MRNKKTESQLDNIRNSIVAVGIDPATRAGKTTVFDFVAKRIFDDFVTKSERRLDDRIPLAGINLTVRHVFDLLDKRRFTDKAGRPVVADPTKKSKTYTVAIKGDVRQIVDSEAERRGVTTGRILQEALDFWVRSAKISKKRPSGAGDKKNEKRC